MQFRAHRRQVQRRGWLLVQETHQHGLHAALGLNAGLVPQITVAAVCLAFMGYGAAVSIVAKAQDLSARAELPVRRIVEDVALEGALSDELEPEVIGCRAKRSNICHGKLQLDLCSLHGVKYTSGIGRERQSITPVEYVESTRHSLG